MPAATARRSRAHTGTQEPNGNSAAPPSSGGNIPVRGPLVFHQENPITAADLLNDRVLPCHDEHDLPVLRTSTGLVAQIGV
ncbi:hypothetical protein ETW23_14110 [Leisingera sp. NJS201]|nr:hypothetical protein ETW23_14110 [Leisingera sp. NJS201]